VSRWHTSLVRRQIGLGLLTCLVGCCGVAAAQSKAVERTVHASKADVEAALHSVQAYSGSKLPAIEGFVNAGEEPLDHFRQPYYQYSLKLTSVNPNETIVRVSAKITAWYAADDPSASGYRALPSNGRLESDLFDRIDEALRGKATAPSTAVASTGPSDSDSKAPGAAASNEPPDSASAAKAAAESPFRTSSGVSADASTRKAYVAPDKQIKQLKDEANTLQEILEHQSKPDDLAVVRETGTPVLAAASDKAKVLFLASAEDEFQVLKVEGDFVHVQMTGLSRGWVRRNELDLSNVSAQLIGPIAAPPLTPAAGSPFQTREETGTFPGDWAPLKGKRVKIVWVQAAGDAKEGSPEKRTNFAKSMFRKSYPELAKVSDLAGVVIVFDEADGGMAAATAASLQELNVGKLSEDAFWRQCWLDPPEAFHKPTVR
jgi:hypothetical protein